MASKRKQLTLFVEPGESGEIEKIREKFNPEQYRLIKSHVTLCREDEIKDNTQLLKLLANLNYNFFTIDFGDPIRFADGKGVLLPAISGNYTFQRLREIILQVTNESVRQHQPHITLMHPGNSTCTDNLFTQIAKSKLPKTLTFKRISLIEQKFDDKWNVIKEYQLK